MSQVGKRIYTIPDEQPLPVGPLYAPPFRVPEREPVPVRRQDDQGEPQKREAA